MRPKNIASVKKWKLNNLERWHTSSDFGSERLWQIRGDVADLSYHASGAHFCPIECCGARFRHARQYLQVPPPDRPVRGVLLRIWEPIKDLAWNFSFFLISIRKCFLYPSSLLQILFLWSATFLCARCSVFSFTFGQTQPRVKKGKELVQRKKPT